MVRKGVHKIGGGLKCKQSSKNPLAPQHQGHNDLCAHKSQFSENFLLQRKLSATLRGGKSWSFLARIERSQMVRPEDTSKEKGEIAADLLAILCCPETKQDVCLLDQSVVQRLNQRISKGELKTKGGQLVTEQIDGGLLRKDNSVVYPIRDQIPIMLIEEGILIEKSDLSST
ncbi:MAG TPA: hypothetical protein VLA60_00300 [Nitrospirales bacterium]|nr:hypothetical protein [Nitrospirales bacterium]